MLLQCFAADVYSRSCSTFSLSSYQIVRLNSADQSRREITNVLLSAAAATPCFNKVSTNFSENSLLGNFQTGPGAHPAPCSVRTGVLPGGESGRGVKLLTSI